MGGLLVLSIGCRNPHLPIAGIISSSAFLGFPNEKPLDLGKILAVKAIGDFLGVKNKN
jgi:alpha-beta hydrolase superfamily lysophospholipase